MHATRCELQHVVFPVHYIDAALMLRVPFFLVL